MQLETHAQKGQVSSAACAADLAVRWVRIALEGGNLIERDTASLEFSEIIGYGRHPSRVRADPRRVARRTANGHRNDDLSRRCSELVVAALRARTLDV